MNGLHSRGNVLVDGRASVLPMPQACPRILSYSLSGWIPLPTFPVLVTTFPSSFPLSLFFPYVPINLFPRALLHTRLVHSNYSRAMQPPAHTLCTHSPHSLSLYQLGINRLKQRASWRAAHRGTCEVLPLHCSTLPSWEWHIHPASFPQRWPQNKSGTKVTGESIIVRSTGFQVKSKHSSSASVRSIMIGLPKLNPAVLTWIPILTNPSVTGTGCRVSAEKRERKMSSKIKLMWTKLQLLICLKWDKRV